MLVRFTALATLALVLFISIGCVRQKFDEPPGDIVIDITPTGTIAQLKAMHTMGQYEQITDDLIIKATVVADDRSGNYFKTIVIQDETGGIELKINSVSLFNFYPVGRTLYIKAQGLYLGDYNGLNQLGGSTYTDDSGNLRLGGIEEALRDQYILKGNYGDAPTPQVVAINDLGSMHYNTLIQLTDVQFATGNFGVTYADAVTKNSVNRTVENCEGDNIILRSSGYASFAPILTPNGKGTITGIATVFGTTKQIIIRDTADVQLAGTRCDGSGGGGGGGGTEELMEIGVLRNAYTGSTGSVAANKKISGVVISDNVASNITNKNLVLQGADGKGIVVRFVTAHTFLLGDSIDVVVGGLELSEYQGALQVNNVPNNNAIKRASGKSVAPLTVTLQQITGNFESYESTLVRIVDAQFTSTGTFNGSKNFTDPSGSGFVHYTTSYSTFKDQNLPTGVFTMVAIPGQGGNQSAKQLSIRNLNDIAQ
jgi:hypothetical protein